MLTRRHFIKSSLALSAAPIAVRAETLLGRDYGAEIWGDASATPSPVELWEYSYRFEAKTDSSRFHQGGHSGFASYDEAEKAFKIYQDALLDGRYHLVDFKISSYSPLTTSPQG